MAAPTVSASLNKSSFTPGETMTLTVTYADPDSSGGTVTVVVTDEAGHASAPATVPYTIADTVTVDVADSGSHTFQKVSDDGRTAVFSAVA